MTGPRIRNRDTPTHRTQAPWTDEQDARFFDAIADGATITAAAESAGRTKGSGIRRWGNVVAKFGWQAS